MPSPVPTEFLSAEQCESLARRLARFGRGEDVIVLGLTSSSRNVTTWARSAIHESGNTRVTQMDIGRKDPLVSVNTPDLGTDRLDDDGLREVMAEADLINRMGFRTPPVPVDEVRPPVQPMLHPDIWDDRTYALSAAEAATLAQHMVDSATAAGAVSIGAFRTMASGEATIRLERASNQITLSRYYPHTEVECSVTVRDPKTRGSGWAGVNHHSLQRIDPQAIAARALDKCRRSANPVAVEPGRFTTILEPQAVADLWWPVATSSVMERWYAEQGHGPFADGPGRSKIGQRVADTRLSLSVDPMDPDGGFLPFDRSGAPYRAVTWIEGGVLRQLAYDRHYALSHLNYDVGQPNPGSYRLGASPGTATLSVDEMIANTARGVLVSRFSNVTQLPSEDLMSDGYTRDGLWLIERGKITKAIKNFRFLESPLIMLNKVVGVGKSERVFQPGFACFAPTLCVNDFNFIGLADAV